MSVLDRLTPPLRSRDPAVRLRAVRTHPPMDHSTLERLAREDPDPRVRQEAVRRIEAPRSLLSLREAAGDPAVRDLAASRAENLLVKIAADDRDPAESLRALGLLEAPGAWSEVVCRARFPEVRDRALARLTAEPDAGAADGAATEARESALAHAVRKAEDPAVRSRALRALSTDDGLAQVAVSAPDRDAASAAARRLRDPAILLSVAERASAKAIRRLAQRRAEELLPAAHPERTRRREASLRSLLDRLDGVPGGTPGTSAPTGGEAFERALAEAESLVSEGPVGADLRARLETARERGRRTGTDPAAPDRAGLLVPEEPAVKPGPAPPAKPAPAARPTPPELEPLLARLADPEVRFSFAELRSARKEAEALLAGFPADFAARGRLAEAVAAAEARARSRKRERVTAFVLAEMADQAESLRRDLEKAGPPEGKHLSRAEVALARKDLTRLERRFAAAAAPGGTPADTSSEPPPASEPGAEAPPLREPPPSVAASGASTPGESPSKESPSSESLSSESPSSEPPSRESPSGEVPSGEVPSGAAPSGDRDRFRRAAAAVRETLDRLEAEREEQNQAEEKRLRGLDRRLAALEAAKTLPLEAAETALRELGALRSRPERWRLLGPERQARLQRRQAALMPRLREARELREWRRWSNLAEQEELIRRARELRALADDAELDRELAKLERQWREVRHADRDRGQELWEEWTKLRDELTARVAPVREAAERRVAEQLEALAGIVARAEEIAESVDPARSGEMSGLMGEWKKHGHGLGHRGDKVWKRFRAANDRYFQEIGEVRKKRREEFQANIAIREALIARAKALSEGTDSGDAREAVRELMAEWKKAPRVPRRRGDELWEEFRTACDDARDRRRSAAAEGGEDSGSAGADDERTAALLARVEETAALPAAERPAAAEKIWSDYRRRRRPGQRLRPSPQEAEAEERLAGCLREAFETAPDAFSGTRFDQEEVAARLARLLEAVDALDGRDGAAPGTESLAERLQRRLGAGRAADSGADAREAAREAETLRERARALGFAFAPAAVEARNRIEKRTAALIAKAPAPPGVGNRRPRRRPPAESSRPSRPS